MDAQTQRDKILVTMERGHSITPLEALEWFGCFRLGARIYDLKRRGYTISSELITAHGKRFAEYHLVRGEK